MAAKPRSGDSDTTNMFAIPNENMTEICNLLDAYLSDELIAEDRARFEAHAARCAGCREALDQQRWIDALLGSPLRAELESPPTSLMEAMRESTRSQRASTGARRRRVGASVAATAAMVLIAVGWIVVRERSDNMVEKKSAETITSVAAAGLAEPLAMDAQQSVSESDSVRASFVGTGDTIAVPVESDAPDVTIVRLYSVYPDTFVAEHQAAIGEFHPRVTN